MPLFPDEANGLPQKASACQATNQGLAGKARRAQSPSSGVSRSLKAWEQRKVDSSKGPPTSRIRSATTMPRSSTSRTQLPGEIAALQGQRRTASRARFTARRSHSRRLQGTVRISAEAHRGQRHHPRRVQAHLRQQHHRPHLSAGLLREVHQPGRGRLVLQQGEGRGHGSRRSAPSTISTKWRMRSQFIDKILDNLAHDRAPPR